MPILSKLDLCRLIPHEGSMCLIDSVQEWDPVEIRCLTRSHLDTKNPLRRDERLESLCGLEYAAQVMAIHIGLLASPIWSGPRIGYIGAIRDCTLHREYLDDVSSDLEIHAMQLFAQEHSVIYSFSLSGDDGQHLSGRASLFLKR
ncbi:MAG: 3-hydroxylacyl-ACP dehydratase [Nitrospirae bacterium]|nr:3-hydroxylacyl-ACP dehydratase [Nitrospirota bacterium]